MAEDGMLLNFAISDSVIKPEAKFKGGTWRDRLSAKKRAQHRPQPGDGSKQNNESKNPNKIAIPGTRPTKRQKTTESREFPDSGDHDRRSRSQQHPRHFVSSLFTSNPESQHTEEPKNDEPMEDAKPTNAPLIDGIDTFTNLGLSPNLAAHLLTKLELKAPTAIQKASITQLLKEQSDAFIQAETGSGKTLAYLLPLVDRIMALSKATKEAGVHRDSGLFAIVLAPTRELCKQISVVLENLLRCANWLVGGTVIGGEKKKSEKARLRKGLNILVATPGRLVDHLDNTQVLDVSNVRWLVLDEGDRLMDMGFEEELQGIVKKLDARQRPSRVPGVPTRRTTILCSATLKMNVQRLGEISLQDAVHIKADPEDEDEQTRNANKDEEESFRVPAQLKQSYAVVAAKLRLVSLTAYLKRTFLRKGSVMKAIVFVSCADEVDFLFEVLSRKHGERGQKKNDDDEDDEENDDEKKEKEQEREQLSPHGTIAPGNAFANPANPVALHRLHGSLPQHVRTATLNSFSKSKDASVMVCTDVASRGLDLPNVDLVIEYDPAFSADDHTHRIGRTARLGRDGRAVIFLQPGSEEKYVEILKRGYRDGGKALTRTDATEILKRGFGGNTEASSKNWEEKTTDWQMDVERWALDNPEYLEMARRAFQSHIRAYATHIAAERSMFNIKELHLGHLAKSFALRDRPGKINVPGLRPGKEETKKDFKADRGGALGRKRKADGAAGDTMSSTDDATREAAREASRKMRAKVKEHMSAVNEFNLA
ncbi:ATP-dependent RNA helicase dbp7 [Penicillium canariense]|uniref:ATP-dependent RNA helicase n=1 Tax=Penicillium canariense TaxID=189055 RepID=A0A9W9LJC6_9EURO|nr:ATP-dependent RNA helicase dbp7 [Penicillium canariense]KAJ5159875.1 ATP-dependent RNA helicase dbp7 [Penicillium canariense]